MPGPHLILEKLAPHLDHRFERELRDVGLALLLSSNTKPISFVPDRHFLQIKPETLNPKPYTLNPKPQTGERRRCSAAATRHQRPENSFQFTSYHWDPKVEAGGRA